MTYNLQMQKDKFSRKYLNLFFLKNIYFIVQILLKVVNYIKSKT